MRAVTVSKTQRRSAGGMGATARWVGVESGRLWAILSQRLQGCCPSNVFRRPSSSPDCSEYEEIIFPHAMVCKIPCGRPEFQARTPTNRRALKRFNS